MMLDGTFETNSPRGTERLGEKLACFLEAGFVVAFYGELGSGKTTMIRSIAGKLGVPAKDVLSPTFTIIHEYSGKIPVYHIDLYRIKKTDELNQIGLLEILYADGICLVEWPEIAENILPERTIKINLERTGERRRKITIRISQK